MNSGSCSQILSLCNCPIWNQAVCVTRFDQSECVIFRLIFALGEPFSEVFMVKFLLYSKLVWIISTLYGRAKLLEHFIFILVTLLLNILLSWAFVTSLNCSVKYSSSWIRCWLLLAVLSDYFGHCVTSIFLLCKFWGLPVSTRDSFPVMSCWKCLGIKKVAQLPENGLRKHAKVEADVKRETPNPGTVCSILNRKM